MGLWKRIQGMFGIEKVSTPQSMPSPMPPPAPPIVDDEEEIVVPEISANELKVALAGSKPPLVIDVREPYEWRMVRMAKARHIPMNEVPEELESIRSEGEVVVMCAHGSRSYSVAAWLIEQGVEASSLAGGITAWSRAGGAVEQG